ncbi:MAG: T9SS type A sorting domain-containing protein [Flavobacteriales bacterium]|nr:T9SS type A sorting domain-containing protein [Flavobacteriales bacterium]
MGYLVNNEGGRYSVYPNPNNGHFIITIGGTPTNGALVVVDALGQRVHHQPLAIGNRTLQLDLDHLASGVYHIRIRSGSDMLNIPVMIQR